MTALVELRNVSVTYRSAEAPSLVDASFEIHAGEIVLVAGPSGCGKSTLLRVVNGLVPHAYRGEISGQLLIDGVDASGEAIRVLSETVGTLLQDPAKQVVGHNVLAEIAFGLENRGVAPADILRRAHAVADRLGITGLLPRAPHELSGGQLQLVAFAGILVLEPRVIIIDEPLANLDPDAADVLLRAVRDYVAGGGAAVIVEHRVDEVLGMGPDRVLYLEEGRVAYSGDVAGFLAVASPTSVKLPFAALLGRADLDDELAEVVADRIDVDAELATLAETGDEAADRAAADSSARVHFEGADLGYGERSILRGIDRRLSAGERIAVLGRNGAGKSTLMRAAVGLIEPSRGRVLVDGIIVADLSAKDLVRTLGYLFQNPGQALFSETVRAELAFGPRNLGVPAGEIEQLSLEALRAVALDEIPGILDRPPRTLSFGQQRRLAVALALTLRPRTLILDEPTAGQDERSSAHFLEAVWALPNVDSIYFITHDVDMALSRADRVIVVDGGGIVADATPAEIVADRSLWHAPEGVEPDADDDDPLDGVLRETDYVRAARRHAPASGRLPSALALARRLRRTGSADLTSLTTGTIASHTSQQSPTEGSPS